MGTISYFAKPTMLSLSHYHVKETHCFYQEIST